MSREHRLTRLFGSIDSHDTAPSSKLHTKNKNIFFTPRKHISLPLTPSDLDKLSIGPKKIRAQVGNINGETEHHIMGNSEIGWCSCSAAPATMRLELIKRIIKNVDSGATKDQNIEITDVGAGRLLQAYLMTHQLIKSGYNSITLNLIDPFFPESVCHIYDEKSGYTPPQSSSFINPCFSDDVTPVSQDVYRGYRTSAVQFLERIGAIKGDTSIKIRVINSAHLLPSLISHPKTESFQHVVLTDPGEPALSNSAHFHMIGSGSTEALPHRDRVLIFFERESLGDNNFTDVNICAKKQGILYIKSNLYDEIDHKDQQFLKKLHALKNPIQNNIKSLFEQHYNEPHFYEDATQSFHQVMDSIPGYDLNLMLFCW